MAEPIPQRAYQAACPGCGAPVLFRSAQSTHAVCGYCQSTVVRQGEVLARIGKLAELFDDHSPLQVGATGTHKGVGFVVVGRIQYQSSQGPWSEWALLQDDGQPATLSEDNGSYVYCRPFDPGRPVPLAADWRTGATTAFAGVSFVVSLVDAVTLRSAQGELPHLPPVGQSFDWAELRSEAGDGPGQVLTLDYAPALQNLPPALSLGEEVLLDDLGMSGLREDITREEKGRQFDCPSCGAPVQVALSSTKRLTCGHCHCVLDLTQQLGPEMVVAQQETLVQPLIALGSQGAWQGKTWQVVGFQHRMGTEPGDSDEHFGWGEYLIYNRQRGFQFLVDSTEGWSLVKPTTGVPKLSPMADSAKYLGVNYKRQYQYWAETGYVTGEFYWPVQRGHRTFNRDFAAGDKLLNQEEAGSEITWSVGSKLNAETVASMFKLDMARIKPAPALLKDASPNAGINWVTLLVLLAIVLVVVAILNAPDNQDCDPNTQNCATSSGSRSSGGSWGGYSSGGSHK